jgi:DNA repair protein RadD
MAVKQLTLGFLSKHIGIEYFNLFKDSFRSISEDGHFEDNLNDKDLAITLFLNSSNDDFFRKKKNLSEFCNALHETTQDRILDDLNADSLDNLKWDKKTADYFIDDLGLPEKFRAKENNERVQKPGYFAFPEPARRFKKLKRYQTGVYFNVYEYIQKTPYARCIIQMPTGSGKTRTSMEIVCETINETGRDVIWLANTEELCDQAFESFQEIWHFLGKRKSAAINHGRFQEGNEVTEKVPTFHIFTIQSLNADSLNEKLESYGVPLSKVELVIVDEAHISIAPTYAKTITQLLEKGAKLIGLTATPGRQLKKSNGKDENKALSEFYFNKLFELDTGEKLPIEYLREEGILSNAYFHSIEGSDVAKSLTPKQLASCIATKTIPESIKLLLTNDSRRNAIIFDQLISLLNEEKKILFFGTSIAHSKLIATLLSMKGFKTAHIDGNSGKYRAQTIEAFKNGELNILCNYGILTTGFDDPKIDVVFMARPTNSIVLYSQIIGRGLRGPLIGGTEYCEVYTVFDNILDLPDNNQIYSYFDEYFVN